MRVKMQNSTFSYAINQLISAKIYFHTQVYKYSAYFVRKSTLISALFIKSWTLNPIQKAQKDDIIVWAGKGHETYQILSTGTIHLDEREVVAEALAEKK